jgi:hypothetical protein
LDTPPPARFSPRQFTLAYTRDGRFGLSHLVGYRVQKFFLLRFESGWRVLHATSYGSLAEALLIAREGAGVPLATWELYEPDRGVKLFLKTDRRWVRKRHRRVRQEFLWLRWPVRQSKRFVDALERIRRAKQVP